jgi:hypothetical protein
VNDVTGVGSGVTPLMRAWTAIVGIAGVALIANVVPAAGEINCSLAGGGGGDGLATKSSRKEMAGLERGRRG